MKPKICVIIPAGGDAVYLTVCLDSVRAIDYPDYEIIVVDDGLSPERLAELRAMSDITLLSSGGTGPSSARNLAVEKTDAPYIAFTDSDCLVDKQWLSALMDGFGAYPHAVGGGGRQELPDDADAYQREVFSFMRKTRFLTDYVREGQSYETYGVDHNASCNVIYKRSAFREIGGFLRGLWPGEDVELDRRLRKAGRKLFFTARSVVYHYKPDSEEKFIGMMRSYGWAQGVLVRDNGGPFRRIQVIPMCLFFYLLLCIGHPPAGLTGIVLGTIGVRLLLGSWRQVRLFALAGLFWHQGFIKGVIKGLVK